VAFDARVRKRKNQPAKESGRSALGLLEVRRVVESVNWLVGASGADDSLRNSIEILICEEIDPAI